MFLEFDIVVRHSARDTFLSAGNEKAFKVIDVTEITLFLVVLLSMFWIFANFCNNIMNF